MYHAQSFLSFLHLLLSLEFPGENALIFFYSLFPATHNFPALIHSL